MGIKEDLFDLLRSARDEELTFAGRANSGERTTLGRPSTWSTKDTLAHIAEWKSITAAYLRAAFRGDSYDLYDDLDKKNAEIYERYHSLPWIDILDALDGAYGLLVEHVQTVATADLEDVDKFPWLEGRSLWTRIVHNGYFHALWHLSLIYMARGDQAYGLQLIEAATHKVVSLDDSPGWQGHYLYNLACFYALADDKTRAIAGLADVFTLRPDLIEWSGQDADLESLWDEPAYKVLIGS
jgi:hypothetical protein